MNPTLTSPSATAALDLRRRWRGHLHLPGDAGYEGGRLPWNSAVDQRPAAVAFPADAGEIAGLVRQATASGLRIAVQGTGHNAGPLPALDDVVLLRTSRMNKVVVDPAVRRVRAGAGALWGDVVPVAAEAGLAVLHGSSPDVGVVGYSLGGGIGWYARDLGLQTNTITGAELTADGEILRVDADHHPDLLWALRGGGGNVGVVTALEFRAFPFPTAYAGMLVWDAAAARAVFGRWATWAGEAPDVVTTALRRMQMPPLPGMPEPFRGRDLVIVDGAVRAGADTAAVLRPLRELAPELDTFAEVPTTALTALHMDPDGPTPVASDSTILAELPERAIDTLLGVAGPGSDTSLLAVELRQLGGALGREAPEPSALPTLDGRFLLFGVALALDADTAARGRADAHRLVEAMRPWSNGRTYLNFAEHPVDVSTGYRSGAWSRLQRIRAAADPGGVLLANHGVPAWPA